MNAAITSRSRGSVYLGGEFFTSRGEVLERAAAMLEKYEPGEELAGHDYNFARDMLDKHPRGIFVIGCGIKFITAYQPPKGRGRMPAKSLRIIRLDGTVALCGFRDVIFGQINGRDDFIRAARHAVKKQIEMFSRRAFKSSLSQIWCGEEKTWIPYRNHTVKYLEQNLEELVDNYVAVKQLNFSCVRYLRPERGEDLVQFADVDDRREWQNWHRQHAQLRIVKKCRDLREVSA